jgi:hypothetical protein
LRLAEHQTKAITQFVHEIAAEQDQVRVFGPRLDDTARGGELFYPCN